MPGLVGFTRDGQSDEKDRKQLDTLMGTLSHNDSCMRDPYLDNNICAGRVYGRRSQIGGHCYSDGSVHVWLDGEFYNEKELEELIGFPVHGDPERLVVLFRQFGDFSFLRHIDGIFVAVIYCADSGVVHLISDRYGFRHLNWVIHNGMLVWASELKAMLYLPGFDARINEESLEEFVNIGWFLDSHTWFRGIELLPAATVLTWDPTRKSVTSQRYWWWDQVTPLGTQVDGKEIAEEVGRLLTVAVERRCRAGERVGVTLSGGLDSRAILAAMPDRCRPIHVVTMGKKGCDDVRIASKVAAVKGVAHHVIELNRENWLASRLEAVWWTDGRKDLMHTTIVSAYRASQGIFDVVLDGATSDLLKGEDLYFEDDDLIKYLRKEFACDVDPNSALADRLCRYSATLGSSHLYYVDSRMRSFTSVGPRLANYFGLEYRIPHMDNRLQEFLYSIPNHLRRNGALCESVLSSTFPSLFSQIPWQKTGVPLGHGDLWSQVVKQMKRVSRRLTRELERVGVGALNTYRFADYATWIRSEPARSFFEKLLGSSHAIYPIYLSREKVLDVWNQHLAGKDCSAKISRYITFELWLQQVYEGKHRSFTE